MHVAAFADEVETHPFLRVVLALGKRLICPRVNRTQHGLDLLEVEDVDRNLVAGSFQILEPSATCRPVEPREVDWALIPGLAFDRRGYRLGRGGGYYDRLLPTLRPEANCWALIWAEQWVDEVPREPHDQPLDGVADHEASWLGVRSH